MNKNYKKTILVVLVLVIGFSIFWLERGKAGPSTRSIFSGNGFEKTEVSVLSSTKKAMMYEPAKEIVNPTGFLNTKEGTTIGELVGDKVVLVDFWTYSCINCQRTTPYLNAWYEKYKDEGLEIISIHTPEFEFEKEIENVRQVAEKFGVEYPIILDNDYSTWRAYKNRYWPRKYLIDIDGYIVYDHIGEGSYEETELKIQELLQERKQKLGLDDLLVSGGIVDPTNKEEVDTTKKKSPEVYFGSLRNELLVNGPRGESGEFEFKESVGEISPNKLYLVGKWRIGSEYAEALEPGAEVLFKYQASKVFMVASSGETVSVSVFRNNNEEKKIEILEEGLYRLIERDMHEEGVLRLRADAPGLRIFTFTFG